VGATPMTRRAVEVEPVRTPRAPGEDAAPPLDAAPRTRSTGRLVAQMLWYTGIGITSTLAYVGLYALLRDALGAQLANVLAWLLTAVFDTSANRRLTFKLSGRAGALRAQLEGMLVFLIGLAMTSGSLAVLDAVNDQPGRALEVGVLLAANLAAGVLRFVLLRVWVFAPHRCRPAA
jgi:putative flippase GtrA